MIMTHGLHGAARRGFSVHAKLRFAFNTLSLRLSAQWCLQRELLRAKQPKAVVPIAPQYLATSYAAARGGSARQPLSVASTDRSVEVLMGTAVASLLVVGCDSVQVRRSRPHCGQLWWTHSPMSATCDHSQRRVLALE